MSSQPIPWSTLHSADFPICDLIVLPTPDPASTHWSDRLSTRGPVDHYLSDGKEPNKLRIATQWYAEYNPISMQWVRKTVFGDVDKGGIDVNIGRCSIIENNHCYFISQDNGVIIAILEPHTSSQLHIEELL
ncbi:MAG TPA: hypothetical protein VF438_02650 [Candidatus Paceibacterota bacterium]